MTQENHHSAQNDQAWFDALSGKTDTGQAAHLRRKLREIELADAAREKITHDWQRLQFALRREATTQKNLSKRSEYFAIAASVLLFMGTVSLMMPLTDFSSQQSQQENATVMRGLSEQVIFIANPLQAANQLETELGQLGVQIVRSKTTEKIQLQIQLTYPVADAVLTVLEAQAIPVPSQGDLRITFLQVNP